MLQPSDQTQIVRPKSSASNVCTPVDRQLMRAIWISKSESMASKGKASVGSASSITRNDNKGVGRFMAIYVYPFIIKNG